MPLIVIAPRTPIHRFGRRACERAASPQISIWRRTCLGSERDSSPAGALADDMDHVVRVEVHVLERESGHFTDPDPAVQKQADHGVVASLLELFAGRCLQQRSQLRIRQDRHRLLRRGRLDHPSHRRCRHDLLVDQPVIEPAQRPESDAADVGLCRASWSVTNSLISSRVEFGKRLVGQNAANSSADSR
jgi:hypothetical protein